MRFKFCVILLCLTATNGETRAPSVVTSRTAKGVTGIFGLNVPLKTHSFEYNESRIYNGDVVQPNDDHYTFMVAIVVIDRSGNYGVVCGGSLINSIWVLTAGHCIDEDFRQAVREARVVCWVGAYDVGVQENSNFRATIKVQTVVEHTPPFKGKQDQRNDIALLRLQAPVNTKNFKPICIGNSYYESGKVTLIGWGRYNGVNTPKFLNRANGDIADLQDCKNVYGGDLVQHSMICARLHNNNGGDAEQGSGDSGGPLFFRTAKGRYIQVGIVSFNKNLNKIDPNNPEEPNIPDSRFPGVYTRTYSFRNFMRNTIHQYDENLGISLCT